LENFSSLIWHRDVDEIEFQIFSLRLYAEVTLIALRTKFGALVPKITYILFKGTVNKVGNIT